MSNPLLDILQQETASLPTAPREPVRGSGGGLADMVPASVEGQVPAALSEGEYVIPADVVSMLGDGSSEAGAKVLADLINEIRGAKQGGDTQQQKSIKDLM